MSHRRRSFGSLWMAPFAAVMGLFALISVSDSPRFETFHALDVVRLMTVGAGFAVALMSILLFIRGPRPEDDRAEKVKGSRTEGIPARTGAERTRRAETPHHPQSERHPGDERRVERTR